MGGNCILHISDYICGRKKHHFNNIMREIQFREALREAMQSKKCARMIPYT
jgi:hypothetical protein